MSLGKAALADAVRHRMQACCIKRVNDYSSRLGNEVEEFQELVEEMTVLESWFFRDLQPFECLRWFVRRRDRGRKLRVLSIPCGTGEEVYSLALTLLDCGLTGEQFAVEGI